MLLAVRSGVSVVLITNAVTRVSRTRSGKDSRACLVLRVEIYYETNAQRRRSCKLFTGDTRLGIVDLREVLRTFTMENEESRSLSWTDLVRSHSHDMHLKSRLKVLFRSNL